MLLHFLRHASSGDPSTWDGPDELRPLDDKGRAQCKRLGKHLASTGADLGPFITSPKLRALQTAESVASALGAPVVVDDRLADDLDVHDLEVILRDNGDPERVVFVGHDPSFTELVAVLAGVRHLPMRKGALVRIEIARPLTPEGGTLRWLAPPDLFKG